MKVLITGADGFVGRNLQLHLAERKDVQVARFTRSDDPARLPALLHEVDFVFHLAGANRPQDLREFTKDNLELTRALGQAACQAQAAGKTVPILYASSIQAGRDNPYGQSKRGAEQALLEAGRSAVPVHIFRLPNVFGKWCRPNYNSAVATFCYNIARGLPIQVNDPAAPVTLVYVDDVIARFVQLMDGADAAAGADGFEAVAPQYTTSVGDLARQIQAFQDSRATLMTERVGTGLVRALYATYVSYLPVDSFTYAVPQHNDPRGVFVVILKTLYYGQFFFYTTHAGIPLGGHYHHTKTEKFLVCKGSARFRFRHKQTGEVHERVTSADMAEVVETVPGWTHDITNIAPDEMVVMLWANDVFDRSRPDTFYCPVAP